MHPSALPPYKILSYASTSRLFTLSTCCTACRACTSIPAHLAGHFQQPPYCHLQHTRSCLPDLTLLSLARPRQTLPDPNSRPQLLEHYQQYFEISLTPVLSSFFLRYVLQMFTICHNRLHSLLEYVAERGVLLLSFAMTLHPNPS